MDKVMGRRDRIVVVVIVVCFSAFTTWLMMEYKRTKALQTPERISSAISVKTEQDYLDDLKNHTHSTSSMRRVYDEIPREAKTAEFLRKAIRVNPSVSIMIRIEHREEVFDKDTISFLIKQPGGLRYIPDKLITKEIAWSGLKNDISNSIYLIPGEIFDENMTLFVLDQKNGNRLFEGIPKTAITARVAAKTVRRDGLLLRFIPEKLANRNLYLDAVKQNGAALQYVPWEMRDREICQVALENSNEAWDYVPKKLVFSKFFSPPK